MAEKSSPENISAQVKQVHLSVWFKANQSASPPGKAVVFLPPLRLSLSIPPAPTSCLPLSPGLIDRKSVV